MNTQKSPMLGTISHGTLRTQDLLPTFIAVLSEVVPAEYAQLCLHPFGAIPAHAQDDDSAAWWDDEGLSLLEAVTEALEACAPYGAYFGAGAGDGSDFGFWPAWDSIRMDIHDGYLTTSEDGPTPGELNPHLQVNDHGNITMWCVNSDGSFYELWAVV